MNQVLVNNKQIISLSEISIEDIFENDVELVKTDINTSIKDLVNGMLDQANNIGFNKKLRDEFYENMSNKVVNECSKKNYEITQAVDVMMAELKRLHLI